MLGAAIVGVIVLRPAATESPLAWWILHSALTPERVLPLIGIGIALGLAGTRTYAAGALLFGLGIAAGFTLYKPILDPLWALPHATESKFMTGPIASVVAGLVLVSGRRLRTWLLLPATGVVGLMLALAIVVTDPSLNDPTNSRAGVLIALWIVGAVSLSLRAFRYGWFDIAGRIAGSWLIAIGLLYGGVALLPKPPIPVPSLTLPSPKFAPGLPPNPKFPESQPPDNLGAPDIPSENMRRLPP